MIFMPKMWTTPDGEYNKLFYGALQAPHLLIAGATGSGKSVIINQLITTVLKTRFPLDNERGAQLILIDPKRVELVQYKPAPHTLIYASEPNEIIQTLERVMSITENRYRQMQKQQQRKYTGGDIYIIIDEYADLVTTNKKQVQPIIQRIAQIGRAAKLHIILATQCPLAEIISTKIKCNFDYRFGLRTRSAQDSRNILGVNGCENLPQYGQAYYMTPQGLTLYKIPMIEDSEIERLVKHWTNQSNTNSNHFFSGLCAFLGF